MLRLGYNQIFFNGFASKDEEVVEATTIYLNGWAFDELLNDDFRSFEEVFTFDNSHITLNDDEFRDFELAGYQE